MANAKYNAFKKAIADGSIDLSLDEIKVMLVDDTYTPNIDTHSDISHITGEVSGTGYTAGGKAISNKSLTQDNDIDGAVLDADDVVWSASSITARGAVIYHSTTGVPMIYLDFGADQVSNNGDFVVQWHTSGILTIS